MKDSTKYLVNKVAMLQRECEEKQAKIDELMLEYCPRKVTLKQVKDRERHQHVAQSKALHLRNKHEYN